MVLSKKSTSNVCHSLHDFLAVIGMLSFSFCLSRNEDDSSYEREKRLSSRSRSGSRHSRYDGNGKILVMKKPASVLGVDCQPGLTDRTERGISVRGD